jgi:hypothetical protein
VVVEVVVVEVVKVVVEGRGPRARLLVGEEAVRVGIELSELVPQPRAALAPKHHVQPFLHHQHLNPPRRAPLSPPPRPRALRHAPARRSARQQPPGRGQTASAPRGSMSVRRSSSAPHPSAPAASRVPCGAGRRNASAPTTLPAACTCTSSASASASRWPAASPRAPSRGASLRRGRGVSG